MLAKSFEKVTKHDLNMRDVLMVVQIIDSSTGYNAFTKSKGRSNCSLLNKIQQLIGHRVSTKAMQKEKIKESDSDLLMTYLKGQQSKVNSTFKHK